MALPVWTQTISARPTFNSRIENGNHSRITNGNVDIVWLMKKYIHGKQSVLEFLSKTQTNRNHTSIICKKMTVFHCLDRQPLNLFTLNEVNIFIRSLHKYEGFLIKGSWKKPPKSKFYGEISLPWFGCGQSSILW